VPDEATYRFNDRVYRSLDEMPPEVRAVFERARAAIPTGFHVVSEKRVTRYVVNGREYGSIEEMPPEARKLFEDRDGNGVPDLLDAARKDAGLGGRILFSAGLSVTKSSAPPPPPAPIGAPPGSPPPPLKAPAVTQAPPPKAPRVAPAPPLKTPPVAPASPRRTGPVSTIRATEILFLILGLILGTFICYLVLR
jgi:hypothetical protein